MAEKSKTVKKVTKIPEASVTIEVEQTAEDAAQSETTEKLEETAQVDTPETSETTEEVIEKKEVLEPVLGTMEEMEDDSNSISWKKVFLYTFIAAAIGFIILGAFFFVMKNYNLNFSQKGDSEIELPSTTPEPTEVEVDLEAYEIEVLNGSGIAGEAATVQGTLETAGFKVSGIGNADSQDFEETEISANSDVDEEYLDELEETLGKRGEVKVVDAPASQTEDVIVTVGSNTTSNTEETEEEVTPTP